MKNLNKNIFNSIVLLLLSLLIFACSDSDNNSINNTTIEGKSKLKISLTDSPGDYEEVNIEVIDVKIKNTEDNSDNGWESIGDINTGIYNLLDLTGGVTAILADNEVPSGYLSQIRLILGTNNTVVIDGVTYPLDTPSAQQSGLKLKVNETLYPNYAYKYLIDFDVDKSVVSAGNSGKHILKPVMRLITEAVSGSIKGTVVANGYQVSASVAIPGSIVTTYPDENGVFYLHGIPAGTYTVNLQPESSSGYTPKIIENVVVVNEQTTDTGTTTFP
ncbi:MAG TPA: DUF4382 domain-containing protein [Flavobacterium sp.]|nr:DUF4382 domain-containing protein [Flavobacterium sp.]